MNGVWIEIELIKRIFGNFWLLIDDFQLYTKLRTDLSALFDICYVAYDDWSSTVTETQDFIKIAKDTYEPSLKRNWYPLNESSGIFDP